MTPLTLRDEENQDDYLRTKKSYSDKIIEHLLEGVDPSAAIVDIGCGIGIPTRHIARTHPNIQGCDYDRFVIKHASTIEPVLQYHLCSAEDLPFAKESIDVVTAFNSLPGFNDKYSLAEIRRILKPKGMFAVISKYDTGNFGSTYQGVIASVVGDLPKPLEHDYSPRNILSEAGFVDIKRKAVSQLEHLTVDGAINLARSTTYWKSIPQRLEEKAIRDLRAALQPITSKGIIRRPLIIEVVKGYKE